ncbi:leucine carboxyl methyltransferase [Dothidotthia symphoricarpi CBS 119687]|uniref:Leucine carboxyl methyltransferase 1 n=1 Tax=Dothidotthia symphoricarpi CBS 119687 TaxID=1392245 RepID=A0A6A6ASG0_9PLEO|nr:leucine carboxyl methyltransferase [Dothidotthia symphoricarpi CBS 119687]KAF2134889.1 leucine carboxyl methyltransferase [Dothidotthia symphoricarpi CBS 119687]
MASSSEIPNLKTLLTARSGGPSRGRGRGRGGLGSSREEQEQIRDNAVKGTDQDAAGSRVSCVELGYLHDPYAKLFATQPATRRLPLLNRGSYVRTSAIDLLVAKFLTTHPSSSKQIVSLGAGTDTRFFRLRDAYPDTRIIYHEIDFASNTVPKIASIQRHPLLHQKLPHVPSSSSSYHSETYNIHALDLRSLADSSQETPLPQLPNLDPNTPTLILSEMCLIYLQSSTVQSILSTLLTKYLQPTTPASLILYEPILPQDAFGRTMISNLQTRNIHLPTLTAYPTLGDQRARLQGYGFKAGARAADTNFIWRRWVSEEEKERVAGLEMLDELEELEMLLKHYCVAWGWRDGDGDVFTKAWADVGEQGGG